MKNVKKKIQQLSDVLIGINIWKIPCWTEFKGGDMARSNFCKMKTKITQSSCRKELAWILEHVYNGWRYWKWGRKIFLYNLVWDCEEMQMQVVSLWIHTCSQRETPSHDLPFHCRAQSAGTRAAAPPQSLGVVGTRHYGMRPPGRPSPHWSDFLSWLALKKRRRMNVRRWVCLGVWVSLLRLLQNKSSHHVVFVSSRKAAKSSTEPTK